MKQVKIVANRGVKHYQFYKSSISKEMEIFKKGLNYMTGLKYTPAVEIEARIVKFQDGLIQLGFDAALITQHTNLFYLSGTSQSSHLFVPASGEPLLMVRKSFQRAKEESPIKDIINIGSIKKIPDVLKKTGFKTSGIIGMELDVIPYNNCLFYQKIFSDYEIMDVSDLIKKLRLIKSPYEVGLLRSACGVIDDVFNETPCMLRQGMTEVELASLFEAGMRRRGYGGNCRMRAFNQDFSFGNITSGKNGAIATYFDGPVGGAGLTPANLPHGAGWKKIGLNEPIYIDYTCVVDGYTADETRMFVIGNLSSDLKDAFMAALAIQDELVKMAVPGVECGELYEKAVSLAEGFGMAGHFMGMGSEGVRFVGHGVGLELDERPIFAKGVKMKLEPGMTFAIEPKFVFSDGAIGIENTFVMGKDGVQVLTHASQNIVSVS